MGRQAGAGQRPLGLVQDSVTRARSAVCGALGEPLFPTVVLRERRRAGLDADPGHLFAHWRGQIPGAPLGPLRYRWAIMPRLVHPVPAYCGNPLEWEAWRPAEAPIVAREPDLLPNRLVLPLIIAETVEFLGQTARDADDPFFRDEAAVLLAEAVPALRVDAAAFVGGRHAWADTFALWSFARRPQVTRVLAPYLIAIAELWAESATSSGGVLHGVRFPFHNLPLVSGSAQLATGLLALGIAPKVVGSLARYIEQQQSGRGGWADPNGPEDLLTTFVAADLLARLDPSFDPAPTAAFFMAHQQPDGWWRAMGPETVWLTAEIATWLEDAGRPFPERFRWPQVGRENRDRRTGLAFFGYLADLGRLFAAVDGLASAPVEIGFADLAGFGDFNNAHGMAMGDSVLQAFAAEWAKIPGAAIRDGGDEFILVGAPGATGLRERLERFRTEDWPRAFRATFGSQVAHVAPRILVGTTEGRDVVGAREALGRAIGPWKHEVGAVGPTGVQAEVGFLGR